VSDLVSQSSKLRVLLAKLHEIRERREKVIVFARLRVMQGILAKVFEAEFELPVRIINGETKLRAAGSLNASGLRTRNAILQDFRSKPGFNVLILSPFVAGVGLTIVEANHVVHYGRWWNPAVESQATDRAYRIGQTKDVAVYLPILRDPSGRVAPTFDERLDLLMDRKQRLAEDFLRPLAQEDEMGDELFKDLSAEAARQS
jgi:SNF2 family DNA or RNA helicase